MLIRLFGDKMFCETPTIIVKRGEGEKALVVKKVEGESAKGEKLYSQLFSNQKSKEKLHSRVTF